MSAAAPANRQDFYKLKGRLIVGIAYIRAGQPDSAKALAEANQGDSQIDPRLELANLASIIYAQTGDKDRALQYFAKQMAANPQQRPFAAKDESWWLRDLRSDPRYQALVKSN